MVENLMLRGLRYWRKSMSKSILVVDDSKIVLDISEFVLASAGYRVVTAPDGIAALAALEKETVDLVMVDINMPGMDGYRLTKSVRSDKAFMHVKILIITTEAEAKDKQKGFDAGADAYLVKPIVPDELLIHVQLLIGKP